MVVPGVADDDTQAAPLAASLVVASFAPECDEISIRHNPQYRDKHPGYCPQASPRPIFEYLVIPRDAAPVVPGVSTIRHG